MASYTKQLVAALGSSKTGLAGSLGYRVLSSDGTTLVSRTTSGVAELAGGGGIYTATATFDTTWDAGRILWDNPSGTYLAAEDFLSPAAIAAAGGVTVELVSPVLDTGDVELIRGDDYKAADSRSLEWSSSSWPTLTSASVYLDLKPIPPGNARVVRLTGSVVTATGSPKTVRVEVLASDTAGLTAPKRYTYHLVAVLASSNVVTLATGTARLIEQPKAAS